MITIKDFAKERGCSESIIYRHIRNNREALGDNVVRENNKTWLTDEGAEYIRGLMIQPPPPALLDEDPRVKRLEKELADAKEQLKEKDRVLYQLIERNQLLQDKVDNILLIEADTEAARARATEAEKRASVADQERKEAESALEKLQGDFGESEKGRSEAEQRLRAAEDIAEMNAQEAERAKNETEALRAELESIKKRSFWQRLFNK